MKKMVKVKGMRAVCYTKKKNHMIYYCYMRTNLRQYVSVYVYIYRSLNRYNTYTTTYLQNILYCSLNIYLVLTEVNLSKCKYNQKCNFSFLTCLKIQSFIQ